MFQHHSIRFNFLSRPKATFLPSSTIFTFFPNTHRQSVLPDIARETSNWAYENKPKTSDFSVRGKKKTKREIITLYTHTNITLNPEILLHLSLFFVLVPGIPNNMTCNTIGRGPLKQQAQKPATHDYQYL